MNEYQCRKIILDSENIRKYSELLQTCFPHSTIFTVEYLQWLYLQNPEGLAVGFDAWNGNELAAHYVTIPITCRVSGIQTKALLSLNTATHPNHQGNGLFTKLANHTYDYAAQAGYSSVVGVANQNSTSGFTKKLGFQLVMPLDAKIGWSSPSFDPVECEEKATSFIRMWTQQGIKWRIANVQNPLSISRNNNSLIITGKTHKPLFKAITIRKNYGIHEPINFVKNSVKMKVFVGVLPKGCDVGFSYFSLPTRLKSSPLNLIYRSLDNTCSKLEKDHIYFDFLDFDIF